MELLIVILAAVFFGYVIGVLKTIMHFKNALINPETINHSNLEKEQIPVLNVEQHGDILYLFEKETDNFMCQGPTLTDLAKNLSEYKNINIALVQHNSRLIWFYNGEIKEHVNES